MKKHKILALLLLTIATTTGCGAKNTVNTINKVVEQENQIKEDRKQNEQNTQKEETTKEESDIEEKEEKEKPVEFTLVNPNEYFEFYNYETRDYEKNDDAVLLEYNSKNFNTWYEDGYFLTANVKIHLDPERYEVIEEKDKYVTEHDITIKDKETKTLYLVQLNSTGSYTLESGRKWGSMGNISKDEIVSDEKCPIYAESMYYCTYEPIYNESAKATGYFSKNEYIKTNNIENGFMYYTTQIADYDSGNHREHDSVGLIIYASVFEPSDYDFINDNIRMFSIVVTSHQENLEYTEKDFEKILNSIEIGDVEIVPATSDELKAYYEENKAY